jgi:hypothetical protein
VSDKLWEGLREGCGTCEFWNVPVNPEQQQGRCRRHPPVILLVRYANRDDDSLEQHQPWMAQTDWCGEYKRKAQGIEA